MAPQRTQWADPVTVSPSTPSTDLPSLVRRHGGTRFKWTTYLFFFLKKEEILIDVKIYVWSVVFESFKLELKSTLSPVSRTPTITITITKNDNHIKHRHQFRSRYYMGHLGWWQADRCYRSWDQICWNCRLRPTNYHHTGSREHGPCTRVLACKWWITHEWAMGQNQWISYVIIRGLICSCLEGYSYYCCCHIPYLVVH